MQIKAHTEIKMEGVKSLQASCWERTLEFGLYFKPCPDVTVGLSLGFFSFTHSCSCEHRCTVAAGAGQLPN